MKETLSQTVTKSTSLHVLPTKTQMSLRINADQSLRCSMKKLWYSWLSKMRPVKIPIRLRESIRRSESSLGACFFFTLQLTLFRVVNG